MSIRASGISAFAAIAIMATSPANASDPAGFVEGKRGALGSQLWIERGGKKVRPAAGTPVYSGDVIHVRGAGNRITLRVTGHSGPKTVKAETRYTVPETSEGWGDTLKRYARSFGWALGITDRETSRGTYSRSGPGDGAIAEFEPLDKLDFLDTPVLKASHDMDGLMIRWCGEMNGVEAQVEDFSLLGITETQQAFGSVTLRGLAEASAKDGAAGPERIVLKSPVAGQSALTFNLDWVALDSVPRPDAIAGLDTLNAEAKTDWGMWLLDRAEVSGDKSYNLVAINLLNEATAEAWPAAYLLNKVTTCPADQIELES